MSRTAKFSWIALNVLALLLIAQASISASAAAEQSDARLKALQKERQTLLRRIVDQLTKLRDQGSASEMEILDANRAVVAAEYDSAESKEDRIAALQKSIDLEKKIRDVVSKIPEVSNTEKIRLQLRGIDAEIALEKVKLGRDPF